MQQVAVKLVKLHSALLTKRLSAVLGATVLILSFIVPQPAMSAAQWSCGAWGKDSSAECDEKRVCTRTLCDSKGDTLSNCRTETRTECSKSTGSAGASATILDDMEEEEEPLMSSSEVDKATDEEDLYWAHIENMYHTARRTQDCASLGQLELELKKATDAPVSVANSARFGVRHSSSMSGLELARQVYARTENALPDCGSKSELASLPPAPVLKRPSGSEGKYKYSTQFSQVFDQHMEFTINGRKRVCVAGGSTCTWYSADSSPSVKGCKKMRAKVGGRVVFYGYSGKKLNYSKIEKCNKN